MPTPVAHALRTLATLVVLALAVTTAPAPVARAMPIEGYPSYQPQSKCSPRAKQGTVLLAEHLLKRYAGTRSFGISRACTASGVSEHKEGRAFDWGLDATSRRDRGYAAHFLSRLRATDRRGNANALARRMGIMYVIWNDRIWSASDGYRRRDYLHGACRKLTACSTTLRHRDHMHLSLTRAAARAETSWYLRRLRPPQTARPKKKAPAAKSTKRPTRKSPAKKSPARRPARAEDPPRAEEPRVPRRAPLRADGVLNLRRTPYTRVRVPAGGEVVKTRFKVRKGMTYSVTAAGLYGWGGPDDVADAVCTWSGRDQAWVPAPRRAVRRTYGRLALNVNGRRVFGDECRGSHVYRTELSPRRTGYLRLRVAGKHPDTRGRLTVVVGRKRARVSPALPSYEPLRPAPTYSTNPRMGDGLVAETVRLGARSGTRFTRGSLAPGATYRVTVEGVVSLGKGVRSDGRCVRVRRTWYDAASIDRRVPGQDHGHLYLDGEPFRTESDGCRVRRHVGEITAHTRGRLRLDLWDPLSLADNSGALSVTVQRLSAVKEPGPAGKAKPRPRRKAWKLPREVVELRADRRRGTVSTMRLRRGEKLRVVVEGRFRSGARADASCVRTASGWQPRDPRVATGQDLLNVWVDGRAVRWRPLGGGKPCSNEARYRTRFTATKPGPVRLSVFDLDHSDNDGGLRVVLRRLGR